MNRKNFTAPNLELATARYKNPMTDRLLGRTTLEWTCDDGHKENLTASLRLTDYEGNAPSMYSVSKLPYVFKTYLQSKKFPLIKNPVPFLTMDAIRFLDTIVRPGIRVLEVGGGNSSLWFLDRGVNLTTYEHDAEWGKMVMNKVEQNPNKFHRERFNLKLMAGKDTVMDLEKLPADSFDILLVDSMNDHTRRMDCLRAAMSKVKQQGWIVLDNSDNPANWSADGMLEGKEMHRFTGYAPMSLFVGQTTFWRM